MSFVRRHPFLVNAIVAGACTSLGDCITQKTSRSCRGKSFDYVRNLSFAVFGTFWSVPGRLFYVTLASRVPSNTFIGAVKGALIGELCLDIPISIPLFTVSTDLMRGRDLEFAGRHLEQDFQTCAISSFSMWFPLSIINLRLVPLKYRVIFDSVFVVVWASVFSFITNRVTLTDATKQ